VNSDSSAVLVSTHIPDYPKRSGKVREIYDLGDRLVLIASDRVSAFDYILPTPIPNKGRLLTQLTRFWLNWLQVPHHLISTDLRDFPKPFQRPELEGRSMLCHKTEVFPVECVVRGYLMGSGWKEYRQSQAVCGIPLPANLQEAQKLPHPLFTPATKAQTGHDENISFAQMIEIVGPDVAEELRRRSLEIYLRAAEYAAQRGIIIADTKFEFGRLPSGQIILIDEVLTPDSSRFWPLSSYQVGQSPPSFDKQIIRDWLNSTTWDKNSPPPELPAEIVQKTVEKYQQAFDLLTKP
jgi:phosphoribosylaminoimidazole-succinocarboxamide synthase